MRARKPSGTACFACGDAGLEGFGTAVRGGAQPGDPLPPLEAEPYIRHVTDTEVIITGTGQGRRVAVLFPHASFPGARFGHRFPPGLDEYGGDPVYLREEIETAADRMMRAQSAPDGNGIIWTTWGDPGPDPEGGPAPAAASDSPPT